MGTKSVRIEGDVYERIRAHKREGETFSEAIERLIQGRSLTELGGITDAETVSKMRDAIEESDETDAEEVEEVAGR